MLGTVQLLLQYEVGFLVLFDVVEQFQLLACPLRHFVVALRATRSEEPFVEHRLELGCHAQHRGVNQCFVEIASRRQRVAGGHTVAARRDHGAEALVGVVVDEKERCRLAQERQRKVLIWRRELRFHHWELRAVEDVETESVADETADFVQPRSIALPAVLPDARAPQHKTDHLVGVGQVVGVVS